MKALEDVKYLEDTKNSYIKDLEDENKRLIKIISDYRNSNQNFIPNIYSAAALITLTFFAKHHTNKEVKWYNLNSLADKAKLKNIKIEGLEDYESDSKAYEWELGMGIILPCPKRYVSLAFTLNNEIPPSLKALEVTDIDIAYKQLVELKNYQMASPSHLLSFL